MSSNPVDGCARGEPGVVADTITFAPGLTGTIGLAAPLPDIAADLDLIGPGARSLTLNGGGDLRILRVQDGVTVTLEGLTLANGLAPKNGGAILNAGRLSIDHARFVGNRAPEDGGAISNEGRGARLKISNSSFAGNSGIESGPEQEEGGAIANIDGEATIANSTFVGNVAPNTGGAIHNSERTAEVTLINCTFVDNSAGDGGGAISTEKEGLINLRNTLLVKNPGGACHPLTGGGYIDEGGNLADDARCGLSAGLTSGAGVLDPAGLADHGGPTDTVALAADSPAIDNGLNAVCAAPPIGNLDQRGAARPLDGNGDGDAACDIGAVESGAIPPAPPPAPPPLSSLVEVTPVEQTPRLRCTRTSCRVLIECRVLQGPGTPCAIRVDVFVRASALRTLDEPAPDRASKRIRIAAGIAEIGPGEIRDLRLRLSKRGKRLFEAGKKHKGVMEIRDRDGTAVLKTNRVTLRLRAR
jgi:predicted outer membrane repeat protein